jgi:hypothetical protein
MSPFSVPFDYTFFFFLKKKKKKKKKKKMGRHSQSLGCCRVCDALLYHIKCRLHSTLMRSDHHPNINQLFLAIHCCIPICLKHAKRRRFP